MRKDAREAVYKLIFEYTYTKEINERTKILLTQSTNINEQDKEYIESTLSGIIENYDALTAKVMEYATGYSSPERLNRADFCALIVGTYELLYGKDIPVGVAISEALNLSGEFGGEKSVGFVNGILASINKNR